MFVHIKAVHHQGLAVVRNFGLGCGHDAAGYLHTQVLVQRDKGELGAGAFDDVAAGGEAGFGVGPESGFGLAPGFDKLSLNGWGSCLGVQKLGHHA